MFRALIAHPQEILHKRHLVYCVRVVSFGCGTVEVSHCAVTHGQQNTTFCGQLLLRSVHGVNTGRLIMFSVITNIYNKKTKGPTLMELFTATGKLKFF
jgi:hypothetical protein